MEGEGSDVYMRNATVRSYVLRLGNGSLLCRISDVGSQSLRIRDKNNPISPILEYGQWSVRQLSVRVRVNRHSRTKKICRDFYLIKTPYDQWIDHHIECHLNGASYILHEEKSFGRLNNHAKNHITATCSWYYKWVAYNPLKLIIHGN